MKVLVLKPGHKSVAYSCLVTGLRQPQFTVRLSDFRSARSEQEELLEVLAHIREDLQKKASIDEPEVIALRVLFGGSAFCRPTPVVPEVKTQLRELIPQAPIHLPLTLELIEGCERVFPGVPIILVFETAFFSALPTREHLYGLGTEVLKDLELRRYGFNGLFHEAACRYMVRQMRSEAVAGAPRILSVCLEPQPEIAAVIGARPMMVTGGLTPLEGIPGHTSSGEIDSTIVLTLMQKWGWGPEQINTMLTNQSGLLALVEKPTTLEGLYRLSGDKLEKTREIIQYRILLACGSAVAAMSGLDGLVFSGRYGHLGSTLAPWLLAKLSLYGRRDPNAIRWDCLPDSLDQVVADQAATVVLSQAAPVGA